MFTGWYLWALSTFMVHLKRILFHLFHCIVNTCALIFCRNAKQMPDDVKSALHTVIQENGHMTSQEADAYLHRLEQTRRYQAETWSWGEGLVIKWRNSSSGCLSFESCIIRWQTNLIVCIWNRILRATIENWNKIPNKILQWMIYGNRTIYMIQFTNK